MDDLANRRRFEVDIDNLRRSTDVEVQSLGERAHKALTSNKVNEAGELIARGKLLSEPVYLLDFLMKSAGLQSRAHANRLIEAGAVLVDKKMVQRNINIKTATSILLDGKELL